MLLNIKNNRFNEIFPQITYSIWKMTEKIIQQMKSWISGKEKSESSSAVDMKKVDNQIMFLDIIQN
jgi:hypothetical protein